MARKTLRRLSLLGTGILIGLLIAAVSAPALRIASVADLFGPGLVRAEAVIYQNKKVSQISLHRGRITGLGASLTLRERDGTVVVVALDPAAQVSGNGVTSTAALRRGMNVQTFQLNGGSAYRVDVGVR
jgi:hypothetical protein